MKILHLLYESRGDSFGIGGVGIRAYEIYRHLRERHEITLLCKKYPGAQNAEIEGLTHFFVGTESESLTMTFLAYAYRAAQWVKEHGNGYDIIVEEFSPAIPTFLHAVSGKPVVLQVQGYTGPLYFRKYNPVSAGVLYVLERLRPRLYRNFIFLGQETVRKTGPGQGKNIAIIPNGVSPSLLEVRSSSGGKYALYLGRLDIFGKGLDTLLRAYSLFAESFPDARLVVAGDGRDRREFMRMIEQLPEGVRRTISVPGWVSGDEKTEVIRGASFVVFPSRHEVQPITVLEAMACGKAVIVSKIPEFGFVEERGAGLSFETGNPGALSEAMLDLSGNAEAAGRMGEKGRAGVCGLTWDRIASDYEGFLMKILGRTD